MNDEIMNLFQNYREYLENHQKLDNLEEANAVVMLQSSMLRSIAHMYVVMYLCDLKNNSFVEIYAMDHVKKLFGSESTISGVLKLVVEHFVAPEFRDEARVFNDVSTLAERLKGKSVLSMDYNATVAGWCRQQFIPVSWDQNGKAREVICVEQRIQAEKMQVENLRRLAETDGMTQLLNRNSGVNYIRQYLSDGSQGMLCLFDVDDFKHFNDQYGHAAGDLVLQGVSACMKETFRSVDILVRAGGDEFLVYALGLLDQNLAETKLAELSDKIGSLSFEEFHEPVSISWGTIFTDQYPGESFEQLFKRADAIMYKNKKMNKQKNDSR